MGWDTPSLEAPPFLFRPEKPAVPLCSGSLAKATMACPWWDNDDDWSPSPEYRVHVSNLPWRTDEDSLKDAFADYDPIDADIITDRETGRSRGFGFVAFKDSESMNNAIDGMDGQELGGRTITVSKANQRSRRQRYGG